VKPQYVQKYPVFYETADHIYVPKHYGIETYGQPKETTRDVPQTSAKFWEFTGSMRPIQVEVVNSFLTPSPRDGIICLQTGGGKTVCGLYIASQLRVPTIVLVHNTFLRDQWLDRIAAFLPKARVGLWNDDSTLDTFIQKFVIRIDNDIIKYKTSVQTPNFKLIKNMKLEEVMELSKIMNVPQTLDDVIKNIKSYTCTHDVTIAMIQGVMRDSVKSTQFKKTGFVF
jgi:hypothetical protein